MAAHRRDASVSAIMWKMRVKDQQTLAHYLQETAAVNSLRVLPDRAKDAIVAAAALYGVTCKGAKANTTTVPSRPESKKP